MTTFDSVDPAALVITIITILYSFAPVYQQLLDVVRTYVQRKAQLQLERTLRAPPTYLSQLDEEGQSFLVNTVFGGYRTMTGLYYSLRPDDSVLVRIGRILHWLFIRDTIPLPPNVNAPLWVKAAYVAAQNSPLNVGFSNAFTPLAKIGVESSCFAYARAAQHFITGVEPVHLLIDWMLTCSTAQKSPLADPSSISEITVFSTAFSEHILSIYGDVLLHCPSVQFVHKLNKTTFSVHARWQNGTNPETLFAEGSGILGWEQPVDLIAANPPDFSVALHEIIYDSIQLKKSKTQNRWCHCHIEQCSCRALLWLAAAGYSIKIDKCRSNGQLTIPVVISSDNPKDTYNELVQMNISCYLQNGRLLSEAIQIAELLNMQYIVAS